MAGTIPASNWVDLAMGRMQGVVKALREQGLLPRVIAGSSVGSIGERCRLPSQLILGLRLTSS